MKSSRAAMDLIIAEEVSSKEVYVARYQRPEWPGEQSGVTIGIGYDCGYATADRIRSDWGPHLPSNMVAALARVAGLKGASAKSALAAARRVVSVPWEAAIQVFEEVDMPKWEKIVLRAIPASKNLNADCFGVIVSLAYNRGPSFDKPGARYTEMRAVKQHITIGKYSSVPGDLRSMARLWPNSRGLRDRRAREAALFQMGLNKMPSAALGLVDEPDEDSLRVQNETGDDRSSMNDYDNVTLPGNDDEEPDDDAVSAEPSVSHAAPPDKATVEAVKRRLAALGYNEFGMLNGDWGGRTVGAIAAFKLDRGLSGPAVINDELKNELDAAERENWHRPVAEARKNATAADIAPIAPGVKQNWWQKFIAYVMGIPAAIGAYVKSVFGDDNDPSSYIGAAKHFVTNVPGEVWLLMVVGIALFILWRATKGQKEIVQAYREGKIN